MTDDAKTEVTKQLIEFTFALVTTAAMLIAFDQRAQITIKAWWMRVRRDWRAWQEGYDAGQAAINALAAEHAPAVISEAERVANGQG